jgi:uncharacterized protein YegP (UPF0339 family)
MTHSSQLTQVLGTMRSERVGTGARPKPAVMKFLVFEDNGGDYGWTLVAADGRRLAESARFASYQEATRAAGEARAGAGSAPIEHNRDDTRRAERSARAKAAIERDAP